ncbi:MAG: DUF1080 domain-containing protein [Armatimonadetes bacterium]|nr:DUF1080 domain-containing protein [Akkermansiaceae bacterium]
MKTPLLLCFIALASLCHADQKAKFRLLFNGRNLSGWSGDGYKVEKDILVCTPEGKILTTDAVFASYILDFDFLLTPGANNGLGIHYPGHGDASSTGMEIQILDDSAAKWKGLEAHQYQGSLYSLAAAKKAALKPVGEWNNQRVTVVGAKLVVEVNGKIILDTNLDELGKLHPDHEGLKRRSGQIAFLGHGDKVSFRNINIIEIAPTANIEGVTKAGFKPLFDGQSLDNWKYVSGKTDNWYVANGILKHTGEKGTTNDLWSEENFKDFTMVFDWRWSGKGEKKMQPVILADGSEKPGPDGARELVEIEELDSGIYLRGNTKSQVNLWNWTVGSGEIYGYRTDPDQSPETKEAVTPKRKADRAVGEWNRMMISVKCKQVTVSLNSEVVIENATLDEIPEEGPIGLQHHGQAIDFANIWVRKD